MPRFAANITTMFDDSNELLRLSRASDLGFQTIEWLNPYDYSVTEIEDTLHRNSQDLRLINTRPGDQPGERGLGALPGRESDFQREMARALLYAHELSIPYIHVMAGIVPEGEDRKRCLDTFISNLDWTLSEFGDQPTQLLIEPLNRQDNPGYLHSTCGESMEIIHAVSGEIGLQFDFYHLQIMEGNLAANFKRYQDHIRHVQFSSVPGRNEPQYGEVNCDYLFNRLDQLGYDGYIGCEYRPYANVEDGLTWLQPYREQSVKDLS